MVREVAVRAAHGLRRPFSVDRRSGEHSLRRKTRLAGSARVFRLGASDGNISPQCRGRSRREPTLGPPHSRRSTGCVVLRVDLRVVDFFCVRERAPTLNSMQLEKSTSHGGVHRQISAGDEDEQRQAPVHHDNDRRGARDHHHLFVVPWRRPRGQVPMLEAP